MNTLNIEKLSTLLNIDFTDVEIIDIICENFREKDIGEYTRIFVFLKESEDWESKDYYLNDRGAGISDPNLEHIPPGHIKELKEIGIELSSIQKHGGNYNQIKVGFQIRPYEIHWYQIDESYDGKSDIVLLTNIPRKVLL